MRFTWWTYWVALRRARKLEILEFRQHHLALRGPNAWLSCWEFYDALRARKRRERGKR